MCVFFSDWFMWEATEPMHVFALIPGKHKPAYRWFNVPLSVDPRSWDSPINHLLLEATQEDTAIVKIDFDAPVLALALLSAILESPAVSSLIDELYFEHHGDCLSALGDGEVGGLPKRLLEALYLSARAWHPRTLVGMRKATSLSLSSS